MLGVILRQTGNGAVPGGALVIQAFRRLRKAKFQDSLNDTEM